MERKVEKKDKIIIGLIIGATIVNIGGLGYLNYKIDNEFDLVNARLESFDSRFNETWTVMTEGQVDKNLKSNDLIEYYNTIPVGTKKSDGYLDYSVRIIPRTYVNGTTAYMFVKGKGSNRFDLAYVDGGFEGVISVPVDEKNIEVTTSFAQGESVKIQKLSSEVIKESYNMGIWVKPTLETRHFNGKTHVSGNVGVEFQTRYSENSGETLENYITDGKIVFKDGETILHEMDMAVMDMTNRDIGSEQYDQYVLFTEDTTVDVTFEAKENSNISVVAMINTKLGKAVEYVIF